MRFLPGNKNPGRTGGLAIFVQVFTGGKKCLKIDGPVGDPQFPADPFSVEFDGLIRQQQNPGDLLGGFAVPDQVGHLDLRRGQVKKLQGQPVEKRGHDRGFTWPSAAIHRWEPANVTPLPTMFTDSVTVSR